MVYTKWHDKEKENWHRDEAKPQLQDIHTRSTYTYMLASRRMSSNWYEHSWELDITMSVNIYLLILNCIQLFFSLSLSLSLPLISTVGSWQFQHPNLQIPILRGFSITPTRLTKKIEAGKKIEDMNEKHDFSLSLSATFSYNRTGRWLIDLFLQRWGGAGF